MTRSADVRTRLLAALRLDLVGPGPDDVEAQSEVLPLAPSRQYLTGFLAPWGAARKDKQDDDAQGELELAEAPAQGDEDHAAGDAQAARRGQFPSSMGVSVLVAPDATSLRITARWGDYVPLAAEGRATGEWQRTPRQQTITVPVPRQHLAPADTLVPDSGGLYLVTSVRTVQGSRGFDTLPAGTRAVAVFLVNRREPVEGLDDLKNTAFAFQATLTLESDAPFVARPNLRGRDGADPDERIGELQYRDVMEYAVGHGTSTISAVFGGGCRSVETTWTPQGEVERVEPAAISGVELGMEALEAMPDAASLRASLSNLTTAYRAWIAAQRAIAPGNGPQGEVATDLLQKASYAAGRIDAGLALLDDPMVLRAFRLTNRAMGMAARQRRAHDSGAAPDAVPPPKWRPFQLAFLLMNLRGFVEPSHDERDTVDLLFFPTGGGKTEAYLGLAAFAILLRRLRDPGPASAGVTVLMRYTLRLLTLDQLGRATTLICALELIRQDLAQKPAKPLGEWPFEIGLWVGRAATPNRMGRKGEKDRTSARAKTIAYQNNSRKAAPVPVETCPWCGARLKPTSFVLVPTSDEPQDLKIVCQNLACRFKGKNPLPIVAVDGPLYRRVPCFVIATVDKFASLPWTGEAGALLGGADRFDRAGFYGPWRPDVGERLAKPLAPPDLIIQDELHLISGPLGTMAGLYETAIDALSTRIVDGRRVRPKIVASTATVRRADAQIRALFGRASVQVFPPPGPDRRTSFFAETMPLDARPGRLYVGVAAQGRSLKVVLLRTYLALLAGAQKAWEECGGAKHPSNPADPYMTLLGYFNSLRELGGSRRIVEDEVASRVTGYGERRSAAGLFAARQIGRDVSELTSREPTDRVSDTKRRLAVGFSDKEKSKDRIDVALATNMISVGLDITRLGLMVVLGQPKATSEYIQATSRVGRDPEKPGLVVTLLNVHRPRDRSHYERFEAFHASFYRGVEATSVTPFASRALDRALPAIVVALGRHSRAALAPPRGALAMVGERSAVAGIADVLSERARAHRGMTAGEEARTDAMIRARVNDLLDSWAKVAREHQKVASPLVYQSFEGVDGPPLLHAPLDPALLSLDPDARKFKAPRSLRDVEPSVNLWLKRLDGSEVELPVDGDDA